MSDIYEIKNVLNAYEIKNVYNQLLDHDWKINTPYGNLSIYYPTFKVSFDNSIFNPYWYGFFSGLVASVNSHLQREQGFELGFYKIKSISLNAQQKSDKFHFHDHRECAHTLVGFLTPEWDSSWGGSLQVKDTTINFSPGNFVLFSGNDLHDAMPVKVNLPFWRMSVGIFID